MCECVLCIACVPHWNAWNANHTLMQFYVAQHNIDSDISQHIHAILFEKLQSWRVFSEHFKNRDLPALYKAFVMQLLIFFLRSFAYSHLNVRMIKITFEICKWSSSACLERMIVKIERCVCRYWIRIEAWCEIRSPFSSPLAVMPEFIDICYLMIYGLYLHSRMDASGPDGKWQIKYYMDSVFKQNSFPFKSYCSVQKYISYWLHINVKLCSNISSADQAFSQKPGLTLNCTHSFISLNFCFSHFFPWIPVTIYLFTQPYLPLPPQVHHSTHTHTPTHIIFRRAKIREFIIP